MIVPCSGVLGFRAERPFYTSLGRSPRFRVDSKQRAESLVYFLSEEEEGAAAGALAGAGVAAAAGALDSDGAAAGAESPPEAGAGLADP